jgi:hypothetical protein
MGQGVTIEGFRIGVGFIDHFSTQFMTALNYGTIVYLHNLKITTDHAKPSHSAFTSLSPVTSSNSGDSSAFALMSLPTGHCHN